MSGWDGCLDGQDIFTTIKENSRSGEVVAELMADTTMEGVQWTLNGRDADWFYLDERHIRLNTSADKVLDREVNESGCGLINTECSLSYNEEALMRMQGLWLLWVQSHFVESVEMFAIVWDCNK